MFSLCPLFFFSSVPPLLYFFFKVFFAGVVFNGPYYVPVRGGYPFQAPHFGADVRAAELAIEAMLAFPLAQAGPCLLDLAPRPPPPVWVHPKNAR